MAYFNSPMPGQTAYFSPLASSDPNEGSYSSYNNDYSTSPLTPGGKESHEMVYSPGLFGPEHQLQTSYSLLSTRNQKALGHDYFSSRQRWKLLAKITGRFIVSFAACAGTVGVFKLYQDKGALTKTEKRMFNAYFVGFTLMLSMNIISAFKAMASVMRWKILATGHFRLRELDLVLALSSFQSVLELMRISVGKPLLCLACFAWILLGVAVQIAVALLGLSFNMDSTGQQRFEASVNVTDMSKFYPAFVNNSVEISEGHQQSTAHLYGDIATYFPSAELGTPGYDYALLEAPSGDTSTKWKYYFRETFYQEKPDAGLVPVLKTNRSVTATPSCQYHPIVGGQYARPEDENVVTVDLGGGKKWEIDWMNAWGTGATTYVHPREGLGGLPPCGPRCGRVYIFQWANQGWNPPSDTGSFFNCTITISDVENANPRQPFHSMSDKVAAMAAGAIALDGYIDKEERQFVRYSASSLWGIRMDSTYLAELIVAKYAAGAIAAYDTYGPSVEVMGTRVKPGVVLSVNWYYVTLTLACILGAQLLCGLFVVFVGNTVFCKDNSYLSTARLLRPLVERLGNSGSSSTGVEIAQTFTRSVRYGVRSDYSGGQPVHHLDVGEDIERLKKFPDGYYD